MLQNSGWLILPRGDCMQDSQWRKGFSLFSRYGLSFDMQIYDHQAPHVAALARGFPDTTVIVEHLAWPILISATDGFDRWAQQLPA